MASATADSPPAGADGQPAVPPANAGDGQDGGGTQPSGSRGPAEHACAKCGAALAPGQDWCLQCGAGAPGSLGAPRWGTAWTVLAVTLVLVLGAAAAAYAAMSKGSPKGHTVTMTVAQAPAATTTPATTTPASTPTPGTTATTGKLKLPLGTSKPPKIPLTAPTPKATTTTPATRTTGTETTPTKTTTTPTTGSSGETKAEEPQPILLDTNAASTYNPYELNAADFGDPSLTIDGDSTTAWTAQVEAATAPKMAEGVLIDLKSKVQVSALKLISATPGMTVQVYGANGETPPSSITDPGWTALSHQQTIKKKHTKIKFRHPKQAYRFIVLWISSAGEASTPQAPGHVDVNELELLPTSGA